MNAIKKLPLTLGINSTYKGYYYLVAALEIALKDPSALLFYTKYIIPTIAREYHTTCSCVEKDIRTVIGVCWKSDMREELVKMCSYRLEKKPTVSEFLDILYWYLVEQEEAKDQI